MRVRVLHVLEALEGGTSRHLVDLVRHASATHHIVVVPPRRVGGLTDARAIGRLRDAGADVRLVEMHRTPWSPANRRALRELRRLLGQVRPDVVHGHSSIGGLLARTAATGLRLPTVYTPNGIAQARLGRAAERGLRRRTDVLVAVSPSEAEVARRRRLSRGEVVVIPNGIDLEAPKAQLDLRAHLGIDAATPLVGSISRLVPQKAPEQLVEAWAAVARRLPEVRFVLVGSGPLEPLVARAAAAARLGDRLELIHELPEAAGVLGQLDVFALASRFEGAPYAPLEAMRAGTAVVLTDVVGSRDAVEHDVTGVLVRPDDPEALGAAIADLLEDPLRRDRLARAGRARVEDRFDVRRMGAALDALYLRLRSQRGGA